MTKPRTLPAGHVAFIVEPMSDFCPTNWRQSPTAYRVVECLGAMRTLGRADSWKFMHNQAAIRSGEVSRWAIHVSFKDRSLGMLGEEGAARALDTLQPWQSQRTKNPATTTTR